MFYLQNQIQNKRRGKKNYPGGILSEFICLKKDENLKKKRYKEEKGELDYGFLELI